MPAPDFKGQTKNQVVNDTVDYGAVVFTYSVAADATTAVTAFAAPFPFRVLDVIVKANATNASGTLVPQKASTALCTGITCAADGAVARLAAGAVTANDANLTFATGDLFKVASVGGTTANTRGHVTVLAVRV